MGVALVAIARPRVSAIDCKDFNEKLQNAVDLDSNAGNRLRNAAAPGVSKLQSREASKRQTLEDENLSAAAARPGQRNRCNGLRGLSGGRLSPGRQRKG